MARHVIRALFGVTVTDDLFDVLQKVTSVSRLRLPMLVDLSAAHLQCHQQLQLTEQYERTETKVLALGVVQNRIQTDRASLNQIMDKLVNQNLIWYMDLGMNYLPPISSLEQSLAVEQNFLGFGQRLNLAVDCNRYTGKADGNM